MQKKTDKTFSTKTAGLARILCLSMICLAGVFPPLPPRSALGGENSILPASAQSTQPTALIELDGTGSMSHDGAVMEYEWIQLDGPKVQLSDPKAAKPYFRTGEPGLYRFQLVVTANSLKSEPFIVEIMIERDNQPPVAMAPREIEGEVGVFLEIDGSESFDPEGDALGYRWRFLSENPGAPATSLDKPVLGFVPLQDGVYELELMVTDGDLVSGPNITRVYIKPKPKPPVAKAKAVAREIPVVHKLDKPAEARNKPVARIAGPATGKTGEPMMLDARGSRGSGDQTDYLTYLWRQKSGPFVSNFEMVHGGAGERFTPPRAGEYEFELVVSDGVLESDPVVHKVRVVNEAQAPVAVVTAPDRAMPGALVKLDASGSYDVDGARLTYRWRQTGGPKVTRYLIDEAVGDAAPAFHPPTPGTYSFELVVSNGSLQSKPVEIDIEVGDTLAQGRLEISGPQVVSTNEPFVLKGEVNGHSGSQLAFNWRQIEGPTGASGTPDGDRITLTLPNPGRYILDVSAVENGKIVASTRRVVEAFKGGGDVPDLAHRAQPSSPKPQETAAPSPFSGIAPPAATQPRATQTALVQAPPLQSFDSLGAIQPPAAPNTGRSPQMPLALEPLEPLGEIPPPPPVPAASSSFPWDMERPQASGTATQATAPVAPQSALDIPPPLSQAPARSGGPVSLPVPSTDGGVPYAFAGSEAIGNQVYLPMAAPAQVAGVPSARPVARIHPSTLGEAPQRPAVAPIQ